MSGLSSSPSWLTSYTEVIDSRIANHLGPGSSELSIAVREALRGGKRIRAVLALLWCEAVSGRYEPAVPVAVAYEMAHAAALVQDDILDDSGFRRGERSVIGKHGLRLAILASNMLLAQVPSEIAEYVSLDADGNTIRRLFDLLGESFAAAILGESLDLEMSQRDSVTESDYEYMIKLKTGALVAAASTSGAIVAGGKEAESVVRAAYEFGELLGMAYQIQDDLLDVTGDETTLGKPAFADIRGGKRNIVVIHALAESSGEDRLFLKGIVARKGDLRDWEIARARDLLSRRSNVDYVHGVSTKYAERARALLEMPGLGASKTKLLELSDYITSRKY